MAALSRLKIERDLPQAEDQGQQRDLRRHHQIIGVVDEAIGAARDQRLAGNDDDPRRPAAAERQEHPQRARARPARTAPAAAGSPAGRARATTRRRARRRGARRSRIMAGRDLDARPPRCSRAVLRAAIGSSASRCSVTSARIDDGEAHAASSSRPAQVKPGPKAVIITRARQAALDQPVEHEQHRRRAHIAVIARAPRARG